MWKIKTVEGQSKAPNSPRKSRQSLFEYNEWQTAWELLTPWNSHCLMGHTQQRLLIDMLKRGMLQCLRLVHPHRASK